MRETWAQLQRPNVPNKINSENNIKINSNQNSKNWRETDYLTCKRETNPQVQNYKKQHEIHIKSFTEDPTSKKKIKWYIKSTE